MKRKYTIEEIKEAINTAQLKVIDNFEERLKKTESKIGKLKNLTRMAVSMQNMMTITELEIELIKELEGK